MLRLHAGLEELLQQPQRQTALPVGLGAASHSIAQKDIQGTVPPLEIGARVPAHRLPILLPGGDPGHRHQGLLLDQRQVVPILVLQAHGRLHQAGQLRQFLRGGQKGAVRALQLDPQPPPPVPEHTAPHPVPHPCQPLPQTPVGCRVRDQFLPQFGGSSPQQGGELTVLAAHRSPAVLDSAVVLTAVEQGSELLIHRSQERPEMETPAGKIAGEILRLPTPPVQHGLGGVVQCVEGGHIVPLPAAGAQRTAPAHPAGRPVKYRSHVVIVPGRTKGGPHGVVQGTEGLGGGLQPLFDPGLGPLIGGDASLRSQPAPQPPQRALRQQEERGSAQKRLIQHGQGQTTVPGPQHRPSVGQQIDPGGPQPPFPPDGPGGQTGQPEGHGIQRDPIGRQIHGQTGGHAQHRPCGDPTLPGRRQHRRHRQSPPQGDVLDQIQAGQGHQHGAQQHRQAGPPRGGKQLHPPARPHGEQQLPVAPAGCHNQDQLSQEIDYVHRPPASLGQVDEAGAAIDEPGDQRHGPGPSEEFPVIEGEAHRKGQDGCGGIPQPVRKAQQHHIAEAGPHQRRRTAHAGARRPNQRHSKGSVVPKHRRTGQHRRQKKMDGCIRKAHQGGCIHAHLLPRSPLSPQPVPPGLHRLLGLHTPLLLCSGRPPSARTAV